MAQRSGVLEATLEVSISDAERVVREPAGLGPAVPVGLGLVQGAVLALAEVPSVRHLVLVPQGLEPARGAPLGEALAVMEP